MISSVIFTARRYAIARVLAVVLCLSMCVCLCMSVTRRYCIETNARIKLVFLRTRFPSTYLTLCF